MVLPGTLFGVNFIATVTSGLVLAQWWAPARRALTNVRPIARRRRLWLNGTLCVLVLALGSLLVAGRGALLRYLGPLPWDNFVAPLQRWPALYVVICLFALDLAGYWAHRVAHATTWSWAFHRMHHSDEQVDLSTAFRHNPVEILWNFAFHTIVVLVLAVPFETRGLFVLLATCHNQWSHANVALPAGWDRRLRGLLVTPRTHLMHHSTNRWESSHNYGAIFSVWDRLFGTYLVPLRAPARFGIEDEGGVACGADFVELDAQPA
jgi:sterol desaturase/sphingolipid hydroxylase (fatty acid hydroxylase superfamily)